MIPSWPELDRSRVFTSRISNYFQSQQYIWKHSEQWLTIDVLILSSIHWEVVFLITPHINSIPATKKQLTGISLNLLASQICLSMKIMKSGIEGVNYSPKQWKDFFLRFGSIKVMGSALWTNTSNLGRCWSLRTRSRGRSGSSVPFMQTDTYLCANMPAAFSWARSLGLV